MASPRQHVDFAGEEYNANIEETPSLLVHFHRPLPGTSPTAESFKSAASDSPTVVASCTSPRFLEHSNGEKEPSPQRPLMSLAAGLAKDHVSVALPKAGTTGFDAASPSSKEEDLSEGVSVLVSFPTKPKERPAAVPAKERKSKTNPAAAPLSGVILRPTLKRLSTIEEEDGADSGSDKHEFTGDERNLHTDKECRVPETGTAKLRQNQREDGERSSGVEMELLPSQQNDEKSAVREKFRFYWQCALQNFGVTNMGMMLKADACKQGFASKDAQGVVDLILQHCVPSLLNDTRRPLPCIGSSEALLARSANEDHTVAATPSETLQKKQIHKILRESLLSSGRFESNPKPPTVSGTANKKLGRRLMKNSKELPGIIPFRVASPPRSPVQIAFVISVKKDRLSRETCEYQTDNVVPRFQSILELGAGIGRLTSMLQKLGRQIVAVDFVEDYVKENKKTNGDPRKRPLDLFVVADATTVAFPVCTADGAKSPRSFDLLVINWLLMYLADDEVTGLLGKLLSTWSRRGGFLFIRESCTEPSDKGSQNRSWAVNGNPTLYRRPEQYTTWINEIARECGVQIDVLVSAQPMLLYQREHGTDSQRCWLVRIIN